MSIAAGARGSARCGAAVLLLVLWLGLAVVASLAGTALLVPFEPCGDGACSGTNVFVAEHAVRHGPLLAVLPFAVAQLLRRRDAVRTVLAGLVAAVLVLGAAAATAVLAG